MCGLASKTFSPAQSGTSSVKRPSSSTGTTSSMPAASHDPLVVLAEAGREVHDAGALVGVDEVGGQHPERVGVVGEEREQRLVGAPDELGALDRAVTSVALRARFSYLLDGGRAEDVARRRLPRRPRSRCRGRPRARGWTAASTAWSSTPGSCIGAGVVRRRASSVNATVRAGSWRGRVASSRRISKLDSGVSAPHE